MKLSDKVEKECKGKQQSTMNFKASGSKLSSNTKDMQESEGGKMLANKEPPTIASTGTVALAYLLVYSSRFEEDI